MKQVLVRWNHATGGLLQVVLCLGAVMGYAFGVALAGFNHPVLGITLLVVSVPVHYYGVFLVDHA